MTEEKNINTEKKDMNNSPAEEVDKVEPSELVNDENSKEEGEVEIINETKKQEPELSAEEELQLKVGKLEDKLIRKAAEFENYKKRTARQFDEISQLANDRIILEILEVADNFNRSFEHDNEDSNFEAFKDGIKLIYNQITGLLEKYDIKPIEAVGKPFDPNFHEAMMQVESDEFKEGTCAMEMNKGYMTGNRVIRHSKVGVAKAKAKENVESDENQDENDEKE